MSKYTIGVVYDYKSYEVEAEDEEEAKIKVSALLTSDELEDMQDMYVID